MGSGNWDPSAWKGYTSSAKNNYARKTTQQIFSSKLDPDLDPKGIKIRESRDSTDNPNSTANMFILDTTGSMNPVLDVIARTGLNTLATEMYKRKPVSDPHLLFGAVSDVACGSPGPLQATQFEADIRIAKQLEKIWLTGGGGGNGSESYMLGWYLADKHTSCDCWEKRQTKGFLFTFGDDGPTPRLTAEEIETVFGYRPEEDVILPDKLLTSISKKWEIFHIMVAQGDSHDSGVAGRWQDTLGERAILLTDVNKLAEVVVSTIQLVSGTDHDSIVKSWDKSTALVVSKAIKDLSVSKSSGGIVAL